MTTEQLTAHRSAYRLTHVLNQVAAVHSRDRFPVDVAELALEAHRIFSWDDPIAEVKSAPIETFEGALFRDAIRRRWMLLYNDRLSSAGRIRFTQAHELGHYILHRLTRDAFECSEDDLLGATAPDKVMEGEADAFAANLLMPLDDFRMHAAGDVNLGTLGESADRYGVSLTAALLRWLEHTTEPAVAISHRDGYMRWARSSAPAMKAGAFYKTKSRPIEVPLGSLASDTSLRTELIGRQVSSKVWFPQALEEASLVEMKLTAHQYDWILSLIVMPRGLSVWKPREACPEIPCGTSE